MILDMVIVAISLEAVERRMDLPQIWVLYRYRSVSAPHRIWIPFSSTARILPQCTSPSHLFREIRYIVKIHLQIEFQKGNQKWIIFPDRWNFHSLLLPFSNQNLVNFLQKKIGAIVIHIYAIYSESIVARGLGFQKPTGFNHVDHDHAMMSTFMWFHFDHSHFRLFIRTY